MSKSGDKNKGSGTEQFYSDKEGEKELREGFESFSREEAVAGQLRRALSAIKDIPEAKESNAYAIIDNYIAVLKIRTDLPRFYLDMADEYMTAIRDSKGDVTVLDQKVAEIDANHAKDFEEHKKARDKETREVLEADAKYHVALNSIDTQYIKKDVIETNAKEAVGLFIKYDYSKKDALNIVTSAIEQMNEEVAKTKDGEKGSKVFGDAIYEAGKRAVNLSNSRLQSKDQGIT